MVDIQTLKSKKLKCILNKSKICLGSANFGKIYGYKNSKVKKKEFLKIFKYAKLKNIKYIDTAFSYSNSQKIIGKYSLNLKDNYQNSELPKSASNPQNWIKDYFKSLK